MSSSASTDVVSDLSIKTKHLQSQLRQGVDVKSLWTTPRRRCFLPLDQKPQLIAYMDEHYIGWRERACEEAAPFLTMTAAQARTSRAQGGIEAMGRAWWASGDTKYAKAYQQLYLRTATGDLFNWGPFAGGQARKEFYAHFLMQDCPAYTNDGRIAVLDHLLELNRKALPEHTANWKLLDLGPEGHNWYIHGIDSLPYLATMFPEIEQSDYQLKMSWSILQEHLRGNYHRDGGSRECTPGYNAGTVRSLWTMLAMMRHNQHEGSIRPSAAFESNLLRATHFLIKLMTPVGGVPAFGDSGDTAGAQVHGLALAAAISGDGLCKWAAVEAHKHAKNEVQTSPDHLPHWAFWLLGIDGAKAYADVKATPPSFKSTCLPDTGFAIMRENWQGGAASMAINAAARGSMVTSHEHNDIFSFDLFAKGTRFLGQAGVAHYASTPGRNYDVSTRAHNCLTIEGQEQLPIANQWRWGTTVIPRIRRWDISDDLEIFQGVHEGFCVHTPQNSPDNPDQQVIHERKILFLKSDEKNLNVPSYWVILDRVITNKSIPCQIWFHGCVQAKANDHNLLFKAADDNMLYICPPVHDALKLTQDTSDGLKAYSEEAKFDLEKHPGYCYAAKVESHVFAWVLMPVSDAKELPRVERIDGYINGKLREHEPMTALRISHHGVVDELYASHLMHDADMGPDQTSATFSQTIFQRTSGGQLNRVNRSALDGCQDVLI